jgi:cobalt-zinc-cadmium efflux system membrane fusion protein
MSSQSYWRPLGFTAALLAALGAGFFLSRLIEPVQPPPVEPAPAVAAQAPSSAARNELKLDPSYLDVVGIKAETVTPGNLNSDIIATATVHAEIRGEGVLAAHVSGTVIGLTKRLGDPVRRGEVVATVESREAAAMAAQREIAQSKLALARSVMAREKDLFEKRVTPRQDLERAQSELEAAEAELRRAQAAMEAEHVTSDGRAVSIVSPLTGKVISRTAELGLFVRPETELFRVADPNFIDVDAAVSVADVQRIAIGDQARIITRSGATLRAVVATVTPTVNEQTRAATVVLDPLPGQQPLTPGDVVTVEITPKSSARTGFVVSEEAVQRVNEQDVVFVRTAEGFAARPVVVGPRSQGRAEIVSGLNAGDVIATANAFLLKAELAKDTGEDQ